MFWFAVKTPETEEDLSRIPYIVAVIVMSKLEIFYGKHILLSKSYNC